MKEKCIAKLKEWFGDMEFDYNIIHSSNDDCIFVTISEPYKKEERNIEIYRVFRLGSGLEISKDLEYVVNLERNSSIVSCIGEIIKTYDNIQ